MAQKRTATDVFEEEFIEGESQAKQTKANETVKKHTLDSDEEDSADDERYNIMNENDIEGEEDGISKMEGEVKLTPFNMKEELEEGHFDADGHFQWDRNSDIKDHWLDNLDWVKIKATKQNETLNKNNDNSSSDESDDDDDKSKKHKGTGGLDVIKAYCRILELMQPKETIKKSLQRLGGKSTKMSSAERWKMKKSGIDVDLNTNVPLVIELTELTNGILTKMGNMDIYEETYEQIKNKYSVKSTSFVGEGLKKVDEDELDMYADDFDKKEKDKITTTIKIDSELMKPPKSIPSIPVHPTLDVMWEFKWKSDDETIHGSYSSAQMQHWVEEGYFKEGVFVRKVGQNSTFNTSNRIDFELYL